MRPRLYVPADPAPRLGALLGAAREAAEIVLLGACAMAACAATVVGAMSLIVGFGLG